MHIEFTFKNFEPSEHLKKYARRRFEKTGRFLGKSPALDLQVVLAVDKHRHRAEIKLTGEGLNITASEQSDDMYATIDLVTDKIESQVRKAAAKAHQSRRKSPTNPPQKPRRQRRHLHVRRTGRKRHQGGQRYGKLFAQASAPG